MLPVIVFSCLTSLLLTFISLKKQPKWEQYENWALFMRKTNVIAGVLSSVVTIVLLFRLHDESIDKTIFAIPVTALFFLFINTFFTDFIFRKGSAILINTVSLLCGLNALYFFVFKTTENLEATIITIILFSLLFMFKSVGHSDVRALIAITLFVAPLFGFNVLFSALFISCLLALFYMLMSFFINKTFFETKSIPAIPFIVLGGLTPLYLLF